MLTKFNLKTRKQKTKSKSKSLSEFQNKHGSIHLGHQYLDLQDCFGERRGLGGAQKDTMWIIYKMFGNVI